MPTKAEITTLIQSKLSGIVGVTTHADHEDLLFNATNSILNAFYPTVQIEDETTGTITTAGSNFDYDVHICKIGRQVTISGIAAENSGVSPSDNTIFTLTGGTEYIADTTPLTGGSDILTIGTARAFAAGSNMNVVMKTDGTLYIGNFVGANEIIYFSITYNTEN